MTLRVWEIDGEDLIVASTERNMRSIWNDYHGYSLRRCHDLRLLSPNEELDITDGENTVVMTASQFARSPGFYPSYK